MCLGLYPFHDPSAVASLNDQVAEQCQICNVAFGEWTDNLKQKLRGSDWDSGAIVVFPEIC